MPAVDEAGVLGQACNQCEFFSDENDSQQISLKSFSIVYFS